VDPRACMNRADNDIGVWVLLVIAGSGILFFGRVGNRPAAGNSDGGTALNQRLAGHDSSRGPRAPNFTPHEAATVP